MAVSKNKQVKRQMAAMFSKVKEIEAKKIEKEEADKLDAEIQARVREHKKKYYEEL